MSKNPVVTNANDDLSSYLSERVLLVDMTIRRWSAMSNDQVATAHVHCQYNMQGRAGRFVKNRLPQNPVEFRKVQSVLSAASVQHRLITSPWFDGGQRMLPRDLFDRYAHMVSTAREDLREATGALADAWPRIVSEAVDKLGARGDPSEYPDASVIAACFSIDVQRMPLPSAQDFRAAITDDQRNLLALEYEQQVRARLEEAKRDRYERLQKAVATFAGRVSRIGSIDDDKEGRQRAPTVRNTIATIVRDAATLVRSLNVEGDDDIERACAEMLDMFGTIDADAVRHDEAYRKKLKDEADVIVDILSAYMNA